MKTVKANLFTQLTSLNSVYIPSGVEEIGDGAFSKCSSLVSISIPGSVNRIGNLVFF